MLGAATVDIILGVLFGALAVGGIVSNYRAAAARRRAKQAEREGESR